MTETHPRITLLIFTRNDLDAAVSKIHDYASCFDSVVVVDSSDPEHASSHSCAIAGSGASLHRAIPLGGPDLLRPFAASVIRTERVLELDTDESISDYLLEHMHDLDIYAACSIARLERELNTYKRLLRLYDPGRIKFTGPSFSFPSVEGQVGFPDKRFCIIHNTSFVDYLESRSRRERHFMVESLERPFTRQYLVDSLALRLGRIRIRPPLASKLIGGGDKQLSDPAILLSLFVESLSELMMGGSPSWAIFRLKYGVEKLRYMADLPPEEATLRNSIAAQVRESGGLVRYLGLDSPATVRGLTESYDWKSDPQSVIAFLSLFRFRNGHPATTMDPYGSL